MNERSDLPGPDIPGIDVAEIGGALLDELRRGGLPERLELDPETVERDLVRLVLALVEFLRQLMEAQAVRRMEAGSLSEEQEEKLGTTLMRAREKVVEVAAEFGLTEADLRLDLGPLGRLV